MGSKRDLPKLRLLLYKLVHQPLALLVVEHHDLDAAGAQVGLAAQEGLVLADDNARDAVEEAGASAHVTGREGGVHGAALVGAGGEAARVVEGRRLAMVDGGPHLHAHVVAAPQELAVPGYQGGTDLARSFN